RAFSAARRQSLSDSSWHRPARPSPNWALPVFVRLEQTRLKRSYLSHRPLLAAVSLEAHSPPKACRHQLSSSSDLTISAAQAAEPWPVLSANLSPARCRLSNSHQSVRRSSRPRKIAPPPHQLAPASPPWFRRPGPDPMTCWRCRQDSWSRAKSLVR